MCGDGFPVSPSGPVMCFCNDQRHLISLGVVELPVEEIVSVVQTGDVLVTDQGALDHGSRHLFRKNRVLSCCEGKAILSLRQLCAIEYFIGDPVHRFVMFRAREQMAITVHGRLYVLVASKRLDSFFSHAGVYPTGDPEMPKRMPGEF